MNNPDSGDFDDRVVYETDQRHSGPPLQPVPHQHHQQQHQQQQQHHHHHHPDEFMASYPAAMTTAAPEAPFLSFDDEVVAQWEALVPHYQPVESFPGHGEEAQLTAGRPSWEETTPFPDLHPQHARHVHAAASRPQLVLPDSPHMQPTPGVTRRAMTWSTTPLAQEHLQIHLENMRIFASASSSPASRPPASPSTSVSSHIGLSETFPPGSGTPLHELNTVDAHGIGRIATPSGTDRLHYGTEHHDDHFDYVNSMPVVAPPQRVLSSPAGGGLSSTAHYMAPGSSDYYFTMLGQGRRPLMLSEQRGWAPPAVTTGSRDITAAAPMQQNHPASTAGLGKRPPRDLDYSHPEYPLPESQAQAVVPVPAPTVEAHPKPTPPAPQRAARHARNAPPQILKCTYANCSSKVLFTRPCDLAKHYRQHFRRFQCRIEGCRATTGFATKKDRLRHEKTHNPSILCDTCGRKFSRLDNLRDHVRRRHQQPAGGTTKSSSRE